MQLWKVIHLLLGILAPTALISCKSSKTDSSLDSRTGLCRPQARSTLIAHAPRAAYPAPARPSVASRSSTHMKLNAYDFPNLWDWTGGAHWDINNALYKGIHDRWLSNKVQLMETEAANIPHYQGRVYAGKTNANFKSYKEGDLVSFDGYFSTSKAPDIATNFARGKKAALLIIESKDGVPVEEISKFALEEEILFLRHDIFLVNRVIKIKNADPISYFSDIPDEYKKAIHDQDIKRIIFMQQLSKPRSVAPLFDSP